MMRIMISDTLINILVWTAENGGKWEKYINCANYKRETFATVN